MATVVRWSGREARALREAQRMSVREFAARLGVNDSAVSSWERRGSDARLRYQTQQILDTELARASVDVQLRFETTLAAGGMPSETSSDSDELSPSASSQRGGPRGAPPAIRATLGPRSSSRTSALLQAVEPAESSRMIYLPPPSAADRLHGFLRSPSRVFLVKGPPGCGKTRLTYFLAEEFADQADVQLHTADSWHDPTQLDLATEILRYASIPRGDDPLLTLEREGAALRRPLLVVVDGMKHQTQFSHVARQVDGVLRQVTHDLVRFLLVVRTPPETDVAAYPVLTASVFEPPGAPGCGASYRMAPWEHAEAQQAWDDSRVPGDPSFMALPPSIQHLVRLPLYMQLVKAADNGTSPGAVNAYRLLDHCVKAILRASGQDADRAVRVLSNLAEEQAPDLVPTRLAKYGERRPAAQPDVDTLRTATPPLLRLSPIGEPEFGHDVVGEYFLATRIASLLEARGRSVATVGAFNDLAVKAATSATARNVFELVVYCLDTSARDLVASVALSPTVTVGTTLPLMLKLVGGGAGFATDEVLRTCARRCTQDTALELARSLLAIPAVVGVLGDDYYPWFVGLLCRFGSTIWADAAEAVERTLDRDCVRRLLASANIDQAEVATFFARHFVLFRGDDPDLTAALDGLLGHPDWRVRAALAEGLGDDHAPHSAAPQSLMGRLIDDRDYKVRAAAALTVGQARPGDAGRHLAALLRDDNWHVRERLLHGLLSDPATTKLLADTAISLLVVDHRWRRCPAHIAPLVERLRLLHGQPSTDSSSRAREQALFALLREIHTGWSQLPGEVKRRLVAEGRESPNWLVRHEADALAGSGADVARRPFPLDAPSRRETYRRLRGKRSVQVALDLHDLDEAVAVARAAAAAGIGFLEVGDPLIKEVGVAAVEHVKREVPDVAVVAEMMSADWGRDQVVLAAEAGADVVFLIGPATSASVSAAVDAGRRLGVPILLDVPPTRACQEWIRDMERAGVDGFAVTTNIDLGVGSRHPLATARAVRGWSSLPVAVSGGFSATDFAVVESADWDILIVGRSVTEAVHPDTAAKSLAALVHGTSGEELDDSRGA